MLLRLASIKYYHTAYFCILQVSGSRRPRGRPPTLAGRGGSVRSSAVTANQKSRISSDSDSELTDRCSTTFPSRRSAGTQRSPTTIQTPPHQAASKVTRCPSSHSSNSSSSTSSSCSNTSGNEAGSGGGSHRRSTLLRRPPFAPPLQTEPQLISPSAASNIHAVGSSTLSAAGDTLASSSGGGAAMSGFSALEIAGQCAGRGSLGSVPRSHLPPNKRLAAGMKIESSQPTPLVNASGVGAHLSIGTALVGDKLSPRKTVSKAVQVS